MIKAILLTGAIISTPAGAEDLNYASFGVGLKTCGDWVRSEGTIRTYYVSWLLGFLTAVNFVDAASGKDGTMPGAGDYRDFDLWMTNYCNAHAVETVATAAVHLAIELRSK